MQIDKEEAIKILEMAEVCFCEGIGPDYKDLVAKIYNTWPELKNEENLI